MHAPLNPVILTCKLNTVQIGQIPVEKQTAVFLLLP